MRINKFLNFISNRPKDSALIGIIIFYLFVNLFTYNSGNSFSDHHFLPSPIKKIDLSSTGLVDTTLLNRLKDTGKFDTFHRKTGHWIEFTLGIDSTLKGIKRSNQNNIIIDTFGSRQFIILSEGNYLNGKKDGLWSSYFQHPIQENEWYKTFEVTISNGDTLKINNFRKRLLAPWEINVPTFTYPKVNKNPFNEEAFKAKYGNSKNSL